MFNLYYIYKIYYINMNKQLSDYVVGDWIPELRKFKHQCPVCQKVFLAKKDAKYCGQGCKSRVAIDKASDLRLKTKGFSDKVKNNFLILEQFYQLSKGVQWIAVKYLTLKGFDGEIFTSIRRTNQNTDLMVIGYYGYQYNQTNKTIKIYNLK